MYPLMQQHMSQVLRDCEVLMSYPIGKLFTSDTPSGKEKKHEARCTKLVDSYYSIESKPHQAIRTLLHDMESTLLLFGDTITPELLSQATGRLQAQYEAHKKTIDKACKSEQVLKDYYSVKGNTEDWIGIMFYAVLELIKDYDLHSLKVVYYDAYKDEKLLINNPSEILLGG